MLSSGLSIYMSCPPAWFSPLHTCSQYGILWQPAYSHFSYGLCTIAFLSNGVDDLTVVQAPTPNPLMDPILPNTQYPVPIPDPRDPLGVNMARGCLISNFGNEGTCIGCDATFHRTGDCVTACMHLHTVPDVVNREYS